MHNRNPQAPSEIRFACFSLLYPEVICLHILQSSIQLNISRQSLRVEQVLKKKINNDRTHWGLQQSEAGQHFANA